MSGRRPVDDPACDSRETLTPRLRMANAARVVVFFGLCFVYVWLWVRPALIYSCGTITNFPVFYKSWSFFRETVQQPGGPIQYISAFASHLFHYSWAGAAVITLQAWAISACTGYLLHTARLPGARVLRFVPAILVLVAYAQYRYHLPLFMGALASLAFASLYVRLAGESRHGVAVCLGLSVLLYGIGAAAFLPFAALCAAHELGCRRWRRVGLYLVAAAVLPYLVGVLAFRISIVNAYTELLPVSWRVLGWAAREKMIGTVYAVYLFPLLGVLAAGLWQFVSGRLRRREGTGKPTGKPTKGRPPALGKPHAGVLTKPVIPWTLGTIILFVAGGAAGALSLDRQQKALLEVHHYACRRMWPEVLAAARRCPDRPHVANAIDRALYHTGRLGEDLFAYVQQPNSLLITGDDHVVQYWHAFDTLMDLGLVNQAEKNLTECLETFGEHPLILERLAKVNLAKGRTDAARIYCGALKRTLFHDRWADECLARLDADPNLSADPETQRLQVPGLPRDSIGAFYDREAMLTGLVGQGGGKGPQTQNNALGNPNRMAFEYLTAWYLLNGQLARVVEQIGRLDEFGCAEIPPLCQEAILIYAYGARKSVDLHGRSISPEVDRRFKHFSSVVNRHGNDKAAAVAELVRDYRGSYFFYYFCTRVANR